LPIYCRFGPAAWDLISATLRAGPAVRRFGRLFESVGWNPCVGWNPWVTGIQTALLTL
jgi:hypothetical protein